MTAWVSNTDVQTWLGADKIDLGAAANLAQVATDAVRALLMRDLVLTTTATEYYDSVGADYVLLHRWPVQSIGSVTYNGQTIPPAAPKLPGWRLDNFNPRKLCLGQGRLVRCPLAIGVFNQITGYDPAQPAGSDTGFPGHIWQALLLTAAAIFNAQAADPNLAAESTAGVFSGSFYPTGVGAVPPGARSLLAPEMRVAP